MILRCDSSFCKVRLRIFDLVGFQPSRMQAVLRCQVCGEDTHESWYPWGSRAFHEVEMERDMHLLNVLSESQATPPTVATVRAWMRVVPQPEPQLRYLGQPSIVSEEEFLSDVGVQRRLDPLIEPAVPGPDPVTG